MAEAALLLLGWRDIARATSGLCHRALRIVWEESGTILRMAIRVAGMREIAVAWVLMRIAAVFQDVPGADGSESRRGPRCGVIATGYLLVDTL